ncbi:amino acid ABC transporter ATP-binding protein [Paucilactobacillus nenjiangensis]|jgi:cystine transport system ATP-binding protein|uniref:Amino acid ABC transporter ATP-binding protein n=1 Tax=Paucilactobacillus nenjiangensis TaxID=1296540 RepID=A0A5P1WYE6_9LACO|nr:amino acid ABC transporter ATP-binding protein [Paucilactobacillus nenjiangensis]QER66682.1 amino acid ABC transporter ATP-binding protein [Paucilactobacillus nenjiangensis]
MLKLEHVDKEYADHHALNDINLEFQEHETTVLLGPSGAGKSTLLRSLNLLEEPERGIYQISDHTIDFSKDISNKEKLQIRQLTGMVFQSWNLFPHLTILQNITEGPIHVLKQSKADAETNAERLLKLVGLEDTKNRFPNQLSGGQQQRISICRALAMNPEYILFDEPTSALDPELEAQVLRVLLELAEEKQSMIVVTHNLEFARRVANKIVFLENGKIEFEGTADEFFNHPTDRIKAFLTGMTF